MRIAIDLQACQAINRGQGIGRFSLEFTRALLRNAGRHEILIALNANFPVEADRLRAQLSGIVRPEQIVMWRTHVPSDYRGTGFSADHQNAVRVRNQFFASLGVDIVHSPSIFEGYIDSAVTGIDHRDGRRHIESATLYDLIPLIHDSVYLADESMRSWYMEKLQQLKRADLLLAISDSSRREGLAHLGFAEDSIVTVHCGVAPAFRPRGLNGDLAAEVKARFGIRDGFVMYSGGIDVRKNVENLIKAYAALPAKVRSGRQLAIVCRVSEEHKQRFTQIAAQQGLAEADLVYTGYVTDDDLISLYSFCDAFVFPSWHEGFGLPVLEAMACGAPVVTSNCSSLPEVVGRADNLFDPHSVDSIAETLSKVLQDRAFSLELSNYGPKRAEHFSWDHAAIASLEAFERAVSQARKPAPKIARQTLAYVSPLPPEQSGISDYSAELLPALSEHYDITVVTPAAASIDSDMLGRDIEVQSVDWFEQHAASFDRVLYQFGNSSYHSHMFDLLPRFPGAVVLHDFYLSGIVAHLHFTGQMPGIWGEYLYRSHGYCALSDMERATDSADPIWNYPACLPVIQHSLGVIAHSQFSRDLARKWYGEQVASNLVQIPQLRKSIECVDEERRHQIRGELGIPVDAFVLCSFGMVGQSKLNEELLNAWLASDLSIREDAYLVFVGEIPDSSYGHLVSARVAQVARAKVTGFVSSATYHSYLLAADAAVQLRSRTRGETSRAVLDCMAAGLPLLVNANGSMAELPERAALVIPDNFSELQLVTGLLRLAEPNFRQAMSARQRRYVEDELDPGRVAMAYRNAIEKFYNDPTLTSMQSLAGALSVSVDRGGACGELQRLAAAVAYNNPICAGRKQLLVDVSELISTDAKSGIQRVVHGILTELLALDDLPYRIEPVYTPGDGHYYYARAFTTNYLGLRTELADEAIDFAEGDVFLALDLAPVALVAAEAFLQQMRLAGVQVYAIVYDVLPLQRPDCFPPEAGPIFRPWITSIGRCTSGLICISRTVAADVYDAMDMVKPDRAIELPIWSFPMGMGLRHDHEGHCDDSAWALSRLGSGPVVLMVGTLEPRKGYTQAVAAFTQLWGSGSDIQLVIVGKQGWMVEELVRSIDTHPEHGRRLHWFQGASDGTLAALYARANALLCASEGEGYGLPLLEAFSRGLPVIARDISVFREVGGERPTYFSGFEGNDLARAVLSHFSTDVADPPIDDEWRLDASWSTSVKVLLDIIRGEASPLLRWQPAMRRVFLATDPQMRTEVGRLRHGRVESTGLSGYLVRVQGIPLCAGTYRLALDLETREVGQEATIDVVSDHGRCILFTRSLRDALSSPDDLQFVLGAEHEDLEVRIRIGAGDGVALRKMVLAAGVSQ